MAFNIKSCSYNANNVYTNLYNKKQQLNNQTTDSKPTGQTTRQTDSRPTRQQTVKHKRLASSCNYVSSCVVHTLFPPSILLLAIPRAVLLSLYHLVQLLALLSLFLNVDNPATDVYLLAETAFGVWDADDGWHRACHYSTLTPSSSSTSVSVDTPSVVYAAVIS